MTRTEVIEFVHSLGNWYKEGTYITKADRIKDSRCVYNSYPTEEEGRAGDCVRIAIGSNGRGRIDSLVADTGCDRCSPYIRDFYKKCLDEGVFDRYAIDMEDW